MGKKRNQQSSNRKLKRLRKRIIDEINKYGTQTINTLVREAVPIQGEEAAKIIELHNKKYQEWLKKFCAQNDMKLTKPLLDAFEEHILSYIQRILANFQKPENNEKSNAILGEADTEQSNNQAGPSGGDNEGGNNNP